MMDAVDLTDEAQMAAWEEGWSLAHEPARCGHARANWKDPNWGTAEYEGAEKCEFCEAVEALRADVEALGVAATLFLDQLHDDSVGVDPRTLKVLEKALARDGVRKVLKGVKDG